MEMLALKLLSGRDKRLDRATWSLRRIAGGNSSKGVLAATRWRVTASRTAYTVHLEANANDERIQDANIASSDLTFIHSGIDAHKVRIDTRIRVAGVKRRYSKSASAVRPDASWHYRCFDLPHNPTCDREKSGTKTHAHAATRLYALDGGV